MATQQQLFDHKGQPLQLGTLLRRGGEGAVHDVAGQPSLVAKLYEKPPAQEKTDKLRLMIGACTADLTRIAAWPLTTLHARPGGPLVGFVMPKVTGYKEVHKLYGPSHRQREFPDADWAFLVHTAMNCAAAFETIHEKHHLMGDVNPGNVLVSSQATVALIDCDSFQVQSNGRTFKCEVGVPEYTPPELQGVTFRDVVRTENHDCFGLAVLIFHLLFMGRHPFAGRFSGRGDMTLERAIQEARFPFARQMAGRKQMDPPPLSPTLEVVTPELANLFERAFVDGARAGRPAARDWRSALAALEAQLVACQRERLHKYTRQLAQCPWCGFEDGTPSVIFFLSFQAGGVDFVCGPADLASLWAELEKIPHPAASTPAAMTTRQLTPAAVPEAVVADTQRVRVAQIGGGVSAFVLLVGLVVLVYTPVGLAFVVGGGVASVVSSVLWWVLARNSALRRERRSRKAAVDQAQQAHRRLDAEWQAAVGNFSSAANQTRGRLEALKGAYLNLKKNYDAEAGQLERAKEEAQRREFLKDEILEDHTLKGIGGSVKATLRSFGIESALDVLTRGVDGIPGVGEKRRQTLQDWAEGLSQSFRFDPKKDVPLAERRRVVAKFRSQQVQLKNQIERGLNELRQLSQGAKARTEQVRGSLTAASTQLAQAQADLTALEVAVRR
jgi:DNA-binding helix-hairpin-helix protein with protein kinase domain